MLWLFNIYVDMKLMYTRITIALHFMWIHAAFVLHLCKCEIHVHYIKFEIAFLSYNVCFVQIL